MNLDIECYYASEIDPDSIAVSFINHGYDIIQLGDIRNIDEEKIKEISPIDLLLGGSPCNDLSLANPKRRGLKGNTFLYIKMKLNNIKFFK